VALSVGLSGSGCYSFAVRSQNANPAPYTSDTVHAYLWNLIEPDPLLVAENCGDDGISTVRARTNYLFMLAGILTLGAWVPTTLEWRCWGGGPALVDGSP
jgi:hypothetical protein